MTSSDPRVRVLQVRREPRQGPRHSSTASTRARGTAGSGGSTVISTSRPPKDPSRQLRRFDDAEIDASDRQQAPPRQQGRLPVDPPRIFVGFSDRGALTRFGSTCVTRRSAQGVPARVTRYSGAAAAGQALCVRPGRADQPVGAEFGFDRIEEAPINLSYRFTGSLYQPGPPSARCSSTRWRLPTASICGIGTCVSLASRQRSRVDALHAPGPAGVARQAAKERRWRRDRARRPSPRRAPCSSRATPPDAAFAAAPSGRTPPGLRLSVRGALRVDRVWCRASFMSARHGEDRTMSGSALGLGERLEDGQAAPPRSRCDPCAAPAKLSSRPTFRAEPARCIAGSSILTISYSTSALTSDTRRTCSSH